jgi:hypothetical protein
MKCVFMLMHKICLKCLYFQQNYQFSLDTGEDMQGDLCIKWPSELCCVSKNINSLNICHNILQYQVS